jgi:hypothetical protein
MASDLLVLDLTCVSTDAKLCRLRFDCLDASLALDDELTDALLDDTVEEEEEEEEDATRPLRWSDDEGGGDGDGLRLVKLSGIPPRSTLLNRRFESTQEDDNDEKDDDGEGGKVYILSDPREGRDGSACAGGNGGKGGFRRCFIMDLGRHLSLRRTFPFLMTTPWDG